MMNEQAGKIQDAELEIMKTLWAAGEPMQLADIRRELAERRGWEDSTVKTLLRRLETKGAVKLQSRGVYANSARFPSHACTHIVCASPCTYHVASRSRFFSLGTRPK